ncbi:MAG TPA: E2/UBC family protein [Verrucomicrobiales bacterium]|jgi:hypothetical protein|nr:E2/UBC family protein [Verrucomicrobiales bacterium]
MRREFVLPEKDVRYLESLGLPWETVGCPQQGGGYILIHKFPVPYGYNVTATTVALRIEPLYPDVQIDMAYFHPGLSRLDGIGINQLAPQVIDACTFQRWSRHRTPQNPWRPGIDCIATHLGQVENWLEIELTRNS